MLDLYTAGGTYMPLLCVLALCVLVLSIKKGIDAFRKVSTPATERSVQLLLHLGIFSFFVGIFSQLVGLLMALQAIEIMPSVSPVIIATGLKTSLIAPAFGTLIFLLSFLVWSILRYKHAIPVPQAPNA